MSNSKFKLTGENTNLARVALMILGPCTNVLREVLRKEISPSDLENKVRTYISNTTKTVINKHQENLVYGHDYSKFDVTLLYFLLRNMCSIQPHSNKWGKNPRAGDRSVSANIERIRLLRNEYGHNSETSISDTDFIKKYQYIKDIVHELEMSLGSSTKNQDEVKELETCPMDPTQSEKTIKELLDLHEKFTDISEDVKEMKNTVLPWNIKVIYGNDVLKWKEDDRSFVETHNFHAMINKVRQQSFVTFVGVPGSGKSATARHIALLLQEKDGYEILPTKDIKDIETYCNPRNPQVFVIDDVLGVFGFDMKDLEKLSMYKDRLNKPTMPETKVLMTCREVVFKHEALSGSFLSNEKHIVQFHSKENALNDQDKYDLLAKYYLDTDLLSANTLSKISKSFPYLCKLFSRKEELRHYGPQFFISPVPCIMELLDNIKIRNKVHYASLVLLMTNQSALSEKEFNTEYFDEMKSKVLKRCKVDPVTCSFHFIDALTEMVGTYTEQGQSGFKFIHDSMLEIVAYHFGHQFPELILQYMDSDYIANYIKPNKYKCRKRKREEDKLEQKITAKGDIDTVADEENVYDLCIKLEESHYNLLADRLFKDVQNGQLFHVFENEALKNPLVLQKFLDVMKSKPYSELFTVFLSNLKEQVEFPKTFKKHFFTSKCYHLLINSRWIDDIRYTCARAIDWVIFYGHNQILHFIIDQTIKNTKAVNDLFQSPFNIRSDDFCTNVESTDCIKRNESDINENSAKKCDVSDDESWSDLCSETDLWTEEGSIEKRRLLNLSCYSGDLLTFQTLIQYYHHDEDFPYVLSWELSELSDRDAYGYDDDDNDDDDWDWHISDSPIVVACKTGHLNILRELFNRGAYLDNHSLSCAPLIFACSEGHLNIVIELLKHGADVNSTSLYNTPLTVACSKGHFDITIELLKHKANVNITVSDKLPLIIACANGYLDIVLEFLKYGADVNITVSDNSPLIVACSNGHLDIVVELLKHGADVNITSLYNSPVIAACSNGHLGILRKLLTKGADINITVDKETPLIAACSKGNLDILLELLKHGADVNITVSNHSPLTAACSISYILNEKNLLRHGSDIKTVHLGMIRELLKNRADVNINFKISRTSPLIAACLNPEINLATVQELLKHGADVNLTVADRSPLIAACSVGRSDVVLELLKHGADVNVTAFPYSPLNAACSNSKSLDIISELLKNRADVNRIVSDKLPLIIACKQGQLEIVSELVKHGADVNMKSSRDSPLIAACSKGHFDVINELLNYGADVNMIVSGRSPLTASCLFEYIEKKNTLLYRSETYDKTVHSSYTLEFCLRERLGTIRKLIKNGADVNGKNCTDSPLIIACSKGHLNIVGELLEQGADVNITVSNNAVDELLKQRAVNVRVTKNSPRLAPWSNRNFVNELLIHGEDDDFRVPYISPLLVACLKGHLNVVNELLKHGADVNMTVSDNSPLLAACSKGHLNVVNDLLKHGADVNMTVLDKSPLLAACSKGHLNVVNELLNHGADVDITVSDNSPLLAACSKGHLNVVNELLNHGADVDITVSDNSPLLIACYKGYLDIISLLLKHGADINMIISGYSPLTVSCLINHEILRQTLSKKTAYANTISGDTLFRLSCSKVHLAIIRQLLKHGADVNVRHCKDSPLNASCSKGHLNIVRELLKHGADVNTIVNDNSPLITALQKRHLDIVDELIKHGADVNTIVNDSTPLITACQEGHLHVVDELIKRGANVNIAVSNNSPLIAACSEGLLEIVFELLKHGADVHMRVSDNSPLIAARSKKHLDIVSELLKHGPDDVNSIDCDNSQVLESASGLTS